VRSAFTWRGHTFEPGRQVLLDVHGTNHDPEINVDADRPNPCSRSTSFRTVGPAGLGSFRDHRISRDDPAWPWRSAVPCRQEG
jgi:hypothetical protein